MTRRAKIVMNAGDSLGRELFQAPARAFDLFAFRQLGLVDRVDGRIMNQHTVREPGAFVAEVFSAVGILDIRPQQIVTERAIGFVDPCGELHRLDLLQHRHRNGVELVGPVERERRNSVLNVQKD